MVADLTVALRDFSLRELGFDLFGVTSAAPLGGGDALESWITQGHHGEMAFMAETTLLRKDPRRFLPGAQSVICVAMSYHDTPVLSKLSSFETPSIVARYACRRDYHDVIRPRLVGLGRFLSQRVPSAHWRISVDTAPVLEKELAWRAGLGWIGKNTLVVNETLGSEMFLGELVVDVDLPVNTPGVNRCGDCRRCMDACPTQAIESPAQMDARRCISYLTIEHHSAIPSKHEKQIGGRLFGCDDCQAVCPFNQGVARPICSSLVVRPELAELSPEHLAMLSMLELRELVKGTPMRRLSSEKLERNIKIFMINTGARAIE